MMKTKSKKTSSSDSDSESEHELSYYTGDRIKLMQQALKLIKPKKLISMTPDCIKDLQLPAIKSLLLEELLGISNKRLRLILAGEHLDVNSSSSSESELESKKDDIISLDDISDSSEICISDDNCMEIQLSERERLEMEIGERPNADKKLKGNHRSLNKVTVKKEHKKTKRNQRKKTVIKKEKDAETKADDSVMNVLNLLELQARARAIRSQLANEIMVDKGGDTSVKDNTTTSKVPPTSDGEDSVNSVIFVSPKSSPVVLVHSESEIEDSNITKGNGEKSVSNNDVENNDTGNVENTEEIPSIEAADNDDYSNDVLIVSEESILEKETEITQQKNSEDHTSEDNESTWKTRWLESPKIKDVLRTNKIYNNLRQSRKQNASSPLHVPKPTNNDEKSNTMEAELSSTNEINKKSDGDVNSTENKVTSE